MVALIPIRAGSKGLPGKNIRALAGRPLYLHAVEQALRVVGRCVISTDIPQVLHAVHPQGCTGLERPAALAGDAVPMDAVIDHAINALQLEAHLIVLLQVTSPLRSDDDLRAGIALAAGGDFDLVMSVTAAERSVLKWGRLEAGRFMPVSDPAYCFTNRQSLPAVFRPNGAVYVFDAASFLRNGGLATERIGAFEMPAERSADIDTLEDLERVEAVLMARSEAERD